MIQIMIYKEIKNIILTSQFQFITLIAIIIGSVSVHIGLQDYKSRLENYNIILQENNKELSKVHVYSYLRPIVAKQPEVLSLFCKGGISEMGSHVKISPFQVPDELNNEINHNSYLSASFEFDFNKVIAILLSLLALLISFNMISDEHERGTLKLLLSNCVPKWKIICVKLLANQLTVSITLIIIFLVGLIFLLFSTFLSLNAESLTRLVLIFLVYECYLFAFVLIGGFFSILTKKSSVSLILCLFVWLLHIVIIPNGSVFLVDSLVSDKNYFDVKEEIEALKRAAAFKEQRWKESNPEPDSEYRIGYINWNHAEKKYLTRGVHPYYIKWCENYFDYTNDIGIEYADKIHEFKKLQKDFENKQSFLGHIIASASIFHILNSIIENLSETSWHDYEKFLRSAQNYRSILISYIEDKNGFSTRRWFTDDPDDAEPWVVEPASYNINDLHKDMRIKMKAYLAVKQYDTVQSRRLNLNDLPEFDQSNLGLAYSLKNSNSYLTILLFYIGVLFFVIIVIFNQYSVST